MKKTALKINLISSIGVLLALFFAPFTSVKSSGMTAFGYIKECINEQYYETSMFVGSSALLILVAINAICAYRMLSKFDDSIKTENVFYLSVSAAIAYIIALPINQHAEYGTYIVLIGLIAMGISAFDLKK